MNKTLTALAAGLVACVPKTAEVEAPPIDATPTQLVDDAIDQTEHYAAQAAAQEALAALESLELIVVGGLIVDAPTGPSNCYGPCADDPVDQAWMQEHLRQVHRLEAFVEAAEEARAGVDETSEATAFDVTETLETLNALEVVEIEAIDWDQSGNCYVSFCPSDGPRRAAIERLVASTEAL